MQQSSTVPYVFICNLFPRRDVAHLAVREPSPFTSRFRCVARWHLKATTFASYIFRMSTHVDLTEADFYSRFPCVMHAYICLCALWKNAHCRVATLSTTDVDFYHRNGQYKNGLYPGRNPASRRPRRRRVAVARNKEWHGERRI